MTQARAGFKADVTKFKQFVDNVDTIYKVGSDTDNDWMRVVRRAATTKLTNSSSAPPN